MHRIVAAVLCGILAGCGMSSAVIHTDAISFGGVIEDTTNKLLVTNLLRARDKAPLHFSDIPVVRESIQQSMNLSVLEFLGRLRIPVQVSDQRTVGTSLQFTPSFEINQLHSKDFITGISSPIDPKVVKYWLDRGLDRRLVMLLFFSAVEIIETQSEMGPVNTIRINNSPRDAADVIRNRKLPFAGTEPTLCDRQSDFERYLKLLNNVRTFFANNYRERRLVARDLKPGDTNDSKNLQAFAALDQSKMQLVYDREAGTYNVYSLSNEQKIAFCFYGEVESAAVSASSDVGVMEMGRDPAADRRSCHQSVIDASADESPRRGINPTPVFFRGASDVTEPSRYCGIYNRFARIVPRPPASGGYPRMELKLYIRSVGEIFQFLGDLLHYQDEVRRHTAAHPAVRLNSPVTFGYCGDTPEPGCDDIFLRLNGPECNSRFTVSYRGETYHVSNFDPNSCAPEPNARKDHTLEVLSVLHQLVGLHRSGADLRSTPAVQVLP